jgi:hypothetical protein
MTTTRALRDDISNALEFLVESELAVFSAAVVHSAIRVSWPRPASRAAFVLDRRHETVEQYLHWVNHGDYSAVLPDASLLQLTYHVQDGELAGHRLVYVPCPVRIDEKLLRCGEPVADVVEAYLDRESSSIGLRSVIRFDFDPVASGARHPAAHFTVNGPNCRVPCIAPMHPYRFIEFVFRHFYPELRRTQEVWFDNASKRSLGERCLAADDRAGLHMAWLV